MAVGQFMWQIPSTEEQQTGSANSGSELPLTDEWSLYVGPVRMGRAHVAIAPPNQDFDVVVWANYPLYMIVAGGDPLDCSTISSELAQPNDGYIWLTAIIY